MMYGNPTFMMPESGFRLGFTNGLMSESMIIWFLLVFLEIGVCYNTRHK